MKKSERRSYGVVLGLLFALCIKISIAFRSGFVFKILTSHKNDKKELSGSAITNCFNYFAQKLRRLTDAIKKITARQFEGSFMLRCFSSVVTAIVNVPGRVIGAFGLTWGAYVILIGLIKRFALYSADATVTDLFVGAITFFASLPLLFTDKTLGKMARDSGFVWAFLTIVFGIPEESSKNECSKKTGQSGAVILGILLGLATYVVSPLDMIVGAAAFTLLVLIMSYPEGGVLISIAISPLLGVIEHSSIVLAAFVLLTAFSYFLKVVRGKRVFKIGVTGLAVYAFILVVFLSGFAPGEANTMENALLCCSLMLIFPLIINLMTNKQWINACLFSFAAPSAIVAFLGFVQYFLGGAPSGWVDESIYSGITQRAVSVFNNPNILGAYLAAMFPIALMLTTSRYKRKIRVLGGIIATYIAVTTILTYSRSAWLALVVAAIIFAVMITPKGILFLVPTAVLIIALSLIFPDTIGARIINFVSLADSANNYRITVWNSSWNLLSDSIWFGIGWGEEAFRTAYINYAADGTQYAMHSHSLFMQIAIQTGIIGLIVFLLSVGSVIKKSFTLIFDASSDKKLAMVSKAAISAASAIMIAGIFDYTWYNFRLMFIFWALLALACAAVNVTSKEESIWITQCDENYSYITVPIPLDESEYTQS